MNVEKYILEKFELERQLDNKNLSEKERDEISKKLRKIHIKIAKENTKVDSFDMFLFMLFVLGILSFWAIFF